MLPAVAVKVLVTPLLVLAAGLAARRWGHEVGGWLVALPLTSGPVAFFLALAHGPGFAAQAATGMLAGTLSQVAFAAGYRRLAPDGVLPALLGGAAAFAVSTAVLAVLHPPALVTFVVVLAVLGVASVLPRWRPGAARDSGGGDRDGAGASARWALPVRMVVATGVVLAVTAAAPVVGARLAGLLSPFPVFGAVQAVSTERTHGAAAASAAVHGLVAGLASPAVFFLVLAVGLPAVGLHAFTGAVVAALAVQAVTLGVVRPARDGRAVPTRTAQAS